VLQIRPITKEVVVGPEDALAIDELFGASYSWCGKEPANTHEFFDCEVQVRAHGESVPAKACLQDGELAIRLDAPIYGVAPGQTAVLYQGTRVLGQTTIDRTISRAALNV
jgi:tRNA-specific 2-thiouridylase